MEKHVPTARVDGIDVDTGEFEMTLTTEGEASDGHILSIKGGTVPERMPMLLSHWNDPTATVGSVTNPQKHLKDAPPRITARGNIEMGGEGSPADVRRDVAHMIKEGHINAVSIRWDEIPGKSVRRVNLPSNHMYFVDAETSDGPERYGMFFEEWRALEGSIVALGAAPGALIGRSMETEGEVSTFWRAMAKDALSSDESKIDALREEIERAKSETTSRVVAHLADVRQSARAAADAGASTVDIINASAECIGTENIDVSEIVPARIGESTVFLPSSLADQLEEERAERGLRVEEEVVESDPDQVPDTSEADQPSTFDIDLDDVRSADTIDGDSLVELVSNMLEESDRRHTATIKALLDHAQGRV